jgi:hypothetical protein
LGYISRALITITALSLLAAGTSVISIAPDSEISVVQDVVITENEIYALEGSSDKIIVFSIEHTCQSYSVDLFIKLTTNSVNECVKVYLTSDYEGLSHTGALITKNTISAVIDGEVKGSSFTNFTEHRLIQIALSPGINGYYTTVSVDGGEVAEFFTQGEMRYYDYLQVRAENNYAGFSIKAYENETGDTGEDIDVDEEDNKDEDDVDNSIEDEEDGEDAENGEDGEDEEGGDGEDQTDGSDEEDGENNNGESSDGEDGDDADKPTDEPDEDEISDEDEDPEIPESGDTEEIDEAGQDETGNTDNGEPLPIGIGDEIALDLNNNTITDKTDKVNLSLGIIICSVFLLSMLLTLKYKLT